VALFPPLSPLISLQFIQQTYGLYFSVRLTAFSVAGPFRILGQEPYFSIMRHNNVRPVLVPSVSRWFQRAILPVHGCLSWFLRYLIGLIWGCSGSLFRSLYFLHVGHRWLLTSISQISSHLCLPSSLLFSIASLNPIRLLRFSTADQPHLSFSSQDDVWADKVYQPIRTNSKFRSSDHSDNLIFKF
jgi:hypothetical protein